MNWDRKTVIRAQAVWIGTNVSDDCVPVSTLKCSGIQMLRDTIPTTNTVVDLTKSTHTLTHTFTYTYKHTHKHTFTQKSLHHGHINRLSYTSLLNLTQHGQTQKVFENPRTMAPNSSAWSRFCQTPNSRKLWRGTQRSRHMHTNTCSAPTENQHKYHTAYFSSDLL